MKTAGSTQALLSGASLIRYSRIHSQSEVVTLEDFTGCISAHISLKYIYLHVLFVQKVRNSSKHLVKGYCNFVWENYIGRNKFSFKDIYDNLAGRVH